MDKTEIEVETNRASSCLVYQMPLPLMSLTQFIERRCKHDDLLAVFRDERYGVLMLTNARTGELYVIRNEAPEDSNA